MLNLLSNYLHQRYQRVVLNGQASSCELIKSVLPQESVFCPLTSYYIPKIDQTVFSLLVKFLLMKHLYFHMFLINTHHRVNWIITCKLSATGSLNGACNLFRTPANKSKRRSFWKKANNASLLPVTFNNTKVVTCSSQKHLGLEQQLTVTIIFKVK